jgi:hypothetical protein
MQLTKFQLTEIILRQSGLLSDRLIQKISNRISDKQLVDDARLSGLIVHRLSNNKFIINQKLT